jgi:hypothetical protein
MTKNGEAGVFPFTSELRELLAAQRDAHDRLKAQGLICPWLFFRMMAQGRGGQRRRNRSTPTSRDRDRLGTVTGNRRDTDAKVINTSGILLVPVWNQALSGIAKKNGTFAFCQEGGTSRGAMLAH